LQVHGMRTDTSGAHIHTCAHNYTDKKGGIVYKKRKEGEG